MHVMLADMAAKSIWSLAFLCVFYVALAAAKEYVPVLLIRSSDNALHEVGVTGLSKWSSDDFRRYILKVVNSNEDITKLPVVMVFAEESLSVEDFSWATEEDYGSFPRLGNESRSSNTIFFPSIHQPLKALEGLKEAGFKWVKYSSEDVLEMTTSGKKPNWLTDAAEVAKGVVLYIDLEDAHSNEDRPDMLRRHDSLVADAYDIMKADREIVLVYTAGHSSWYEADGREKMSNSFDYEDDGGREVRSLSRNLLAVPDADNSSDIILTPNKTGSLGVTGLLYTKSDPFLITEDNTNGTVLTGFYKSSVLWDDRSNKSSLVINYSKTVKINVVFTKKNGYWSTPYVDLDTGSNKTSLTPNVVIEAPMGFSYHCSQAVSFKKDSTELIFMGFQLQGLMPMPKEGQNIAFGDGYDCVYFFTAPILSGLFVTMLLGFIMIWGLSMIMDIRTMDRFDDPKGKTITIANAE
ncbi:hypothetical protein J437_LFUL014773 [Ladona fulva]|uniref:V-type proton ATPase subunit S1 n=1 Tax=Ladona fulva TaxID=123851 RepID=A0A8K0P6K4_LADFU|nr:hypothetical protein J437_LFUL014773 [Ladona fulva]